MTDQPHLDEEALAELQDVMEEEFDILIQTYISDSSDRLATLKTTLEAGDMEGFSRCAHSFKGSSINIGVPRLGELCRDAELAGKSGDLAQAGALVARIEEEFRVIQARLETLLVQSG